VCENDSSVSGKMLLISTSALEVSMSIYLVQHGLCLPKDIDPSRGLSDEGMKKVGMIAEVAAGYKVQADSIMHSGKKRAKQTAEIFAAALKPSGGVFVRKGLAPMDDAGKVAMELDPASNMMLVGHLPFMERLVSQLTTGSTEHRPFKFQNGGIVCLDRDDPKEKWYVKWALMPDIS